MREIKISQNYFALVDDEDFERVIKFNWHVQQGRAGVIYGKRNVQSETGKWTTEFLHRFVLNLLRGDNKIVDHINRDGLDCRKCNLRIVTVSLNGHNTLGRNNKTSKFKGVSLCKRAKPWVAQIGKGEIKRNLGRYKTELEAAQAYNTTAKKLWGANAVINVL